MKRFRFPLQSVATVRSWKEQQRREHFGQAVQRLQQADDALQQARERVHEVEKLLRSGRNGSFRPAEQATFLVAYQHELDGVGQLEKVRQEAKTAADGAREAWQLARAELRAVGQLEQRARQHHRLAEERAEQVALDEIASMRATLSRARGWSEVPLPPAA